MVLSPEAAFSLLQAECASALLLPHRFSKIEHQHSKKHSSSPSLHIGQTATPALPCENNGSDGKAQWIRSGSQMLLLSSTNKGQNNVAVLLLEVPLVWPFPQGRNQEKQDVPRAHWTLNTDSLPFLTFKSIYSKVTKPPHHMHKNTRGIFIKWRAVIQDQLFI